MKPDGSQVHLVITDLGNSCAPGSGEHEPVASQQDGLCTLSCFMLSKNIARMLCCGCAYASSHSGNICRRDIHISYFNLHGCAICTAMPMGSLASQPVLAGSDLSGMCYPSAWASWLMPSFAADTRCMQHTVLPRVGPLLDSRTECMHSSCGTVSTCQGLPSPCSMPCCRVHLHRVVPDVHKPRGSQLLPKAPGVLDPERS